MWTQQNCTHKAATTTTNLPPTTVEAKIRRLKELRSEVRALTAMIREERRRSKGKDSKHRHHSVTDKMRSEIGRQFRKWRKKVLSKIHLVMHRLDNLEGEMHRTKDNLQKVLRDDKERDAKRRPPSSHSAESIRRVQIHRRGERGSVCQNHGECKPGHCCLRDVPMSTVPLAVGQGTGHCVRYAYDEGAICEHSCACAAQLLCFRKQQKTHANSSLPLVAVCKKASSTDLLNGIYENALDAVFEHHKMPLNANIS
uniref:TAZ-type domain-containing protein n=1 Tax=Globodera pallida TaxID=36090 RepID=A0A183BMR0_GLOPA